MMGHDRGDTTRCEGPVRPRVLVLSRDLLFPSTIVGRAGSGFNISVSADWRSVSDSATATCPEVVLLDLDSLGEEIEGALRTVAETYPQARLVGFGSHVHTERFERAASGGCHDVVSRGRLQHSVTQLLSDWIRGTDTSGPQRTDS